MNQRAFTVFGLCVAVGVAGFATVVHAAEITGSVSVTVATAGSVGSVVTPTPAPAPAPVAAPTVTGTSIRDIPISTTSNIGFAAPPSAAAGDQGTAGADDDTAATAASSGPAPAAAKTATGPTTAVAIAGAPNQTFSIMLPATTAIVGAGGAVSLTGFQHDAGTTPSVGASGGGVVNVAADVRSPSAGTPGGQAASAPSVLAAAFSAGSPFVNITVTYN